MITDAKDGDELLPIEYDNNYVTVFPGETVEIQRRASAICKARVGKARWIRHAANCRSHKVGRGMSTCRPFEPQMCRSFDPTG